VKKLLLILTFLFAPLAAADGAGKIDLAQYESDARFLGVVAMPSSFIYGRDGQPFDKHMGFRVAKQDQYEAAIRRALGLE